MSKIALQKKKIPKRKIFNNAAFYHQEYGVFGFFFKLMIVI